MTAIGSLAVVGLLFAPWIVHLIGQLQLVAAGFWIERPDTGTFWDTYRAFLFYSPVDHGVGANPLRKVERWLVLGLLVLSLLRLLRGGPMLLAALSFYVPIILAVTISLLSAPVYVVRYVSFATGAFWTLVVAGLGLVPGHLVRFALGAVMLLGVAVNLPALSALRNASDSHEGDRSVTM